MITTAPRSIASARPVTAAASRSASSLAPVAPGFVRAAKGRPAQLQIPKTDKPQQALRLSVRFPEGQKEYRGIVRVDVEGRPAGWYATYPPGRPGAQVNFVAILTDLKDPARAAELQRKLQAGTLAVTVSTDMPGVDVKVRPFA